jgi:hypothetical protein
MSGSDVAIVKLVCPSNSQTPGKIQQMLASPQFSCAMQKHAIQHHSYARHAAMHRFNSIAEKVGDVVPFNITTHTPLCRPGDAFPNVVAVAAVTLCTILAVAIVIAQQVATLCGEQTQHSSSLHSRSIPPGAAEVTTHKLSNATLRQSASTLPTCSIPCGAAKS